MFGIYSQCTDLTKICLGSKFDTNSPNIEQVMTSCAINGTLGSERVKNLTGKLSKTILMFSCLCSHEPLITNANFAYKK